MTDERRGYELRQHLQIITGQMVYHLDVFGDELARREGYKAHSGLDAVRFYLIQRYGWLPANVRGMSFEDMRFVLEEEMAGWTLPREARIPSGLGEDPKIGGKSKTK